MFSTRAMIALRTFSLSEIRALRREEQSRRTLSPRLRSRASEDHDAHTIGKASTGERDAAQRFFRDFWRSPRAENLTEVDQSIGALDSALLHDRDVRCRVALLADRECHQCQHFRHPYRAVGRLRQS